VLAAAAAAAVAATIASLARRYDARIMTVESEIESLLRFC